MTGLRERQKAGRQRDILAAAAKLFQRPTNTAAMVYRRVPYFKMLMYINYDYAK